MASLEKLDKVDGLLEVIDRCSPADEVELASEHIHGARTYLLGAMPNEFRWNLEQARETLERMDDSEALRKAEKILAGLSGNRRARRR